MTDVLALIPAGIDTYRQPVVYMTEDCHICRAEGFVAQTRVRIDLRGRSIIAELNVVTKGAWLPSDHAALSMSAWTALAAREGDRGRFSHPEPAPSASQIRAKAYGARLTAADFTAIVQDTLAHRLSDLELAAFLTACTGDRLDEAETVALTRAMLEAGDRLDWGRARVLDKHCVGGLPGNRTSPIVVAIVAAAGEIIPKTSSRAITSPAGTADTMEVMTPVDLDEMAIRKVVEAEGGCVVWGGALNLSPADDHFIRIERPLDLDSTGQLVASILSKKSAVGSSHVLIDMPVGPTAKVRSQAAAMALGDRLIAVGRRIGLQVTLHISDGAGPVGRGVGPALEAMDVLSVLRREATAPQDLRARSLDLAGDLLDIAVGNPGTGRTKAEAILDSGAAETKFMAICALQGGFNEPEAAPEQIDVLAPHGGTLQAFDNRLIARIAKLAGAPRQKIAGVRLHVRTGDTLEAGQPMFTIYAATRGELDYSHAYAMTHPDVMTIVEVGP